MFGIKFTRIEQREQLFVALLFGQVLDRFNVFLFFFPKLVFVLDFELFLLEKNKVK